MDEVQKAEVKASRCPQYLATFAATLGAFIMGTFLGWSLPVINNINIQHLKKLTVPQYFSIGSSTLLGAAFGCIPAGIAVNIYGRKWCLVLAMIPSIMIWITLTIVFYTDSHDFVMLQVLHFYSGVAGGAVSVVAPIYTAEISESEIRGSAGFLYQLNLMIGFLFMNFVGCTFSTFTFSTVCSFVSIAFLNIILLVPDSPLFLVSIDTDDGAKFTFVFLQLAVNDEPDAAKKAMSFLRGKNYPSDVELAKMGATLEKNPIPTTFKNLVGLKRRATIKGLFICLGLMFFQQFSGAILYVPFETEISTDFLGFGTNGIMLCSVVMICGTFISATIVDKIGRRTLLMLSGFIISICNSAAGIYYFYQDRASDEKSLIRLMFLVLFIVMYSIGYGPVPWLMSGELFAPDVKGFCVSLGATFYWLLGYAINSSWESITSQYVHGFSWIHWTFAVASLIGVVFVFLFVPETKRLTLDEIQENLEK